MIFLSFFPRFAELPGVGAHWRERETARFLGPPRVWIANLTARGGGGERF
jgi:hypothetical protein